MFVSSNVHRSVASTFAFKNLQKNEIMQNDLNQLKNFKRIETNSSFDELKKNSDASKMLMLNLNERFEQAKRLLRDREKLQKLKKMKTKIRALKREANEIIEESTKKIESKEIESFSNNLMQSIFISKKVVTSTVSSQKEDVTASRKRMIKLDKILLYHDKSIKKHRNYVKNLTTIFRLILDDFSTKNSKIVYAMQSLAEESKKTWYRFEEQNLDHDYIFKKYCEHLLDLIENSINRHLHHAQLFSNAKQKKKQSMQVFDAFLSNLENQLTSYIEKQRIIHLFIKLRSKLRAALTNYQDLLIIKKKLLIFVWRITWRRQSTLKRRLTVVRLTSKRRSTKVEKERKNEIIETRLMTNQKRRIVEKTSTKRSENARITFILFVISVMKSSTSLRIASIWRKNSRLTRSSTSSKDSNSSKKKSLRRRLISRRRRKINKIWDQFNTKCARRRRSDDVTQVCRRRDNS